jgi:acyl-CoA reductase-like NAD-dependent aldehyde dehydrogenase
MLWCSAAGPVWTADTPLSDPTDVACLHAAVNFVCDDPNIKAISFVGSDQAGTHIWERGTGNGKRVQSNMGAKNHGVILPDANKTATLNALVGAGRTWQWN